MVAHATIQGVAPNSLVTLAPTDGGLVCQVVSAALTVCRRLPAPVTPLEVVLWIILGGVGVTLWGTALLYLDGRRKGRRWTDPPEPASEVIPFIHFPKRHTSEDTPHE